MMHRFLATMSMYKQLPWDGTYLGPVSVYLSKEGINGNVGIVASVSKVRKDNTIERMWPTDDAIIAPTTVQFCQVRNTLPSILDELKPIFSIEKYGTHSTHINRQLYILRRPYKLIVDEVNVTIENMEAIRKILAFRRLLGISCNYESTLVIYSIKHLDSSELRINSFDRGLSTGLISNRLLHKWFSTTSVRSTIMSMIAGKEDTIRDEIRDAVTRVNPFREDLVTRFYNRVCEYL